MYVMTNVLNQWKTTGRLRLTSVSIDSFLTFFFDSISFKNSRSQYGKRLETVQFASSANCSIS